jgi:hypothetical protein
MQGLKTLRLLIQMFQSQNKVVSLLSEIPDQLRNASVIVTGGIGLSITPVGSPEYVFSGNKIVYSSFMQIFKVGEAVLKCQASNLRGNRTNIFALSIFSLHRSGSYVTPNVLILRIIHLALYE